MYGLSSLFFVNSRRRTPFFLIARSATFSMNSGTVAGTGSR